MTPRFWAGSTARRPASSATNMDSWGPVFLYPQPARPRWSPFTAPFRWCAPASSTPQSSAGGEDNLTHLHFLEFSALGALYGLSGRERPAHEASRPFDAERDGMVLGEGGGMLVIEREGPARARGAHVQAIVTGMGASNNHLGMVESASVTQEIAIGASFQGIPLWARGRGPCGMPCHQHPARGTWRRFAP